MRCFVLQSRLLTVSRLCYSWPLSPGMHIFAFSCQTRYRIASSFVPLYRPGRRINSAPTPRHNLPATMDGCLEHRIEHRTSTRLDSTRLDLTCLALHTTRPTCTCACAAQHPARVGIVVGVARSGIIYHVSNPRLGEGEGGRRKTTAKTTTTPSRQHQQPHRPAVCRLLSRPSCP
jgi:hypothetical protein